MKWTQEFTSFGKPIVNTVTTIEYRLWQRSLDARWGNGFFNDWRCHYLDDLHLDAIRILMDHVERLDSPWTDIKIPHLEGAVSRVPESATAYGSRNARFGLVIQARWEHGRTLQLRYLGRRNCATHLRHILQAGSTPISLRQTKLTA
jgi:hypothetical protein